MIGFYLLGGRGIAFDAALVLALLVVSFATSRSYWRDEERGRAIMIGLICGGGLLWTLVRWWQDEQPVRLLILLSPLACVVGFWIHRIFVGQRQQWARVAVILAAINWVPIPLLISCGGSFLEEAISDIRSTQNLDGRLRAVIVRHSNGFDPAFYCVVVRPQSFITGPMLWPERTLLVSSDGGAVAAVTWITNKKLIVTMGSGEPALWHRRSNQSAIRSGQVVAGIEIQIVPAPNPVR